MDNFYAELAANIANVHITHPEVVQNPKADRVSCIFTMYEGEIFKEIKALSSAYSSITSNSYEYPLIILDKANGMTYENMVTFAANNIINGERIAKMILGEEQSNER